MKLSKGYYNGDLIVVDKQFTNTNQDELFVANMGGGMYNYTSGNPNIRLIKPIPEGVALKMIIPHSMGQPTQIDQEESKCPNCGKAPSAKTYP